MKITKRQLKRIIRESWDDKNLSRHEELQTSREDQSKAHPGYVGDVLDKLEEPLFEAIEALGSPSEVMRHIEEWLQ